MPTPLEPSPRPEVSRLPGAFQAPPLPWRALRGATVGAAQAAFLAWVLAIAWGSFDEPLPIWGVSLLLAVGGVAGLLAETARRPVRATAVVVLLASVVLVVGHLFRMAPVRDIESFVVSTLVTAVLLTLASLVALAPLLFVGALARRAHARAVLSGDHADGGIGLVAGALGLAVMAFVDLPVPSGSESLRQLRPDVQLALGTLASIACGMGLALVLGSYARGSLRGAFVERVERGEEPRYRVDVVPEGAVLVRLGEASDDDYRAAAEDAEMFPLSAGDLPTARE